MAFSQERENSCPTVSTVTVPSTDVSTPTATPSPQSSTPPCSNPYQCGQDNHEMKLKLTALEDRISKLEETATERRSFLKKAESLLLVFKVVLIAIPVILSITIAITAYFAYGDSKLLNIVSSIIGIATIAECILLPILWKNIEERLKNVEDRIKDK